MIHHAHLAQCMINNTDADDDDRICTCDAYPKRKQPCSSPECKRTDVHPEHETQQPLAASETFQAPKSEIREGLVTNAFQVWRAAPGEKPDVLMNFPTYAEAEAYRAKRMQHANPHGAQFRIFHIVTTRTEVTA